MKKKALGYCVFSDEVFLKKERDGKEWITAGWTSVRTRLPFELEVGQFAEDERLKPVGGISVIRIGRKIIASQAFVDEIRFQ